MPTDNKTNQLGSYLRSLRLERNKTLADVSKEVNRSMGYLSRIELGQVPEGPSIELLDNLAGYYQIDAMLLVELAEQDKQRAGKKPPQVERKTDPTTAPASDARPNPGERGTITKLSLEQVLVNQLEALPGYIKSRTKNTPSPLPAENGITDLAYWLAHELDRAGESFLVNHQFAESIEAYHRVEQLYLALDKPVELAVTKFRLARVYQSTPYSQDISERDYLKLYYEADHYDEEAFRLFNDNWKDMSLGNKCLAAESLVHWARTDLAISLHSQKLASQVINRLCKSPTAEKLEPLYDVRLRLAAIKRDKAALIYEDIIREIETNQLGLSELEQDERLELLAETTLRAAGLYSDYAFNDVEEDKRDTYREKYAALYVQAIEANRELIERFAPDIDKRKAHLKRLIHTHTTFGYSLQLGQGAPDAAIAAYPKTLWQYSVARDLTALLPTSEQIRFRKDEADKLASLDQQIPSGPRTLLRRRVQEKLDMNEYGTLSDPILKYNPAWE